MTTHNTLSAHTFNGMQLTWNRGFVLVQPQGSLASSSELRRKLTSLPDLLWEPRFGRFRVLACHVGALRRALAGLGVPLSGDVAAAPAPLLDLWGQRCALARQEALALREWLSSGQRGVIVLPAGANKVRVAAAAMATTRLRSLLVVPTRAMVKRWRVGLERWYCGPIATWGLGNNDIGPITVATYACVKRHFGVLGQRFGMLIIDEAHRFARTERLEALDLFVAESRLGLTGPPPAPRARASTLETSIGPVLESDRAVGRRRHAPAWPVTIRGSPELAPM